MRWLVAWVGLGLGCATTSEPAAPRTPSPRYRTAEEVVPVFLSHKSSFDSCAKEARLREPGVTGKLVVELDIAPAGEVTAVRALTQADTWFAQCMVGTVLPRLKFGPAPAREFVSFPFKF